MIKSSSKKQDRVKKKRDRDKIWANNQDCPSKSGTVGGNSYKKQAPCMLHNIICEGIKLLLTEKKKDKRG